MKSLFGENEYILNQKMQVLAKQNLMDDLVKLIETSYATYPDNVQFVTMMYRVKKDVKKDAKGALNIYERYLKNNYNYTIITNLADAYKEQGMDQKYLDILKHIHDLTSYDPKYATWLCTYYFSKQNYSKALEYADEALKLACQGNTICYGVT